MPIAQDRFCINRKIAPNLSIESFFCLVKKCGLNKVELRNDMLSGKVTDELSSAQLNALADEYEIEIVTINALQYFNLPEHRPALLKETENMLKQAKAINCRGVILCPNCSANDRRSAEQKEQDTIDALVLLAPLFKKYQVTGLVEPLGFEISSLRSHLLTQSIIHKSAAPYKMVLDTFHYYLSDIAQAEFDAHIDINTIGLVHLSGVEEARLKHTLTDEDRIMLSEQDKLNSKQQVDNLERLGYQGIYAFEPFSSQLNTWSKADIEREIHQSIVYLQN
ncbi:TIM barrel protein [Yersinia kristensenii]|uniref:TIM barrel protein n=1 Tax=Yersinia kristensenii TaxID=28152 RepID=UPI0001A54588|nr:TIM barrel protein [Yersinia kristensenii]EEP93232.1 Xylose isomerase domain protein TIM barrel [Yersinia kristensenii ATCC 33638]EEP93484.1 Xylose isomerase domain protein TIM barrel [Yersinia kristensenii ATCC 33638]PEH54453.1 inosose isomerase [Yersinia kristensenii]SUP68150.1 Predicted sugar epimerase [Yersinia kristensenii]